MQQERGYRSIQGLDQWTALGCAPISKQFAHVGLAFPVYRLGQLEPYTWVLRPDHPRLSRGRPIKYEWPKGLPPCFDVLPRYRTALTDPAVPLWFTEGAKKADALATAYGDAIIPVNLNGVWGFRGTRSGGGKLVLPDVDEIAWNGRRVVLAFDSDVVRKAPVAAALRRLAALLIARGVSEVQMLVLPHLGDEKLGVDDFLGRGHTTQELESHLTTLQSGLAQARVRLTVHPETGHDLFLPHGWAVVNGSLATLSKHGEPSVIYSGMLIASAIGVDLATGDAMLTVRWQGRGGRRDELTAPKAELGTRQGVLAWLGARPDAPVHESNARDVAAYLIEFAQENLDALPRVATSARLGLVADGLVLPTGSVGYAEPVQYAGRLPIRFGSDAAAYPKALQAISTWPEAWAAWIMLGLTLASPLIARIRPRRNPACYLAGESGSGKTTLAQFAVGCWGDPSGKPFLVEAHRTTAAGFRQSLTDLNGLPLLIDEAHTTSDPQRLEALVYEFANGQSYSKGTAEGTAAGGEPLRGALILAGEALPEFRHAGAGKRVLWLDCSRSPPLGAGTLGRPGSDEHRLGGARAHMLEQAWEVGAGLLGRAVAERCWADWATLLTDYRRVRDDPALQPLAAWRESLALGAVALQISAIVTSLELPPLDVLLPRWVELLTVGQEQTDPALEAFERLRTLLAQCDEDTNGAPGWVLRRLRGETVAYRKTDDPYWRVPTGTPPFESRIGKSAVQIYGRTWLRHGLIRSLDGRSSKTLGAPHRTTAAAICITRSVLAGEDDDVET
ncbi:MAG: DUF927 domain-containing protein [Oscillochloridaceae bacterium umkhey_bin13]